MKPGFKTSEFYLSGFKVAVTAVVALCGLFGVGVPTWLRPDAPWIATAALVVGGFVTTVYTAQRAGVKRAAVHADASIAETVASVEAPAPASAGYTLIGLLVLIAALVLVAIGAYLLIVGAVVSHALSATGLILLLIGIVLAVVGRHVEGGGPVL